MGVECGYDNHLVGECLVSCRFSSRCGSSDMLDIILKVEMMARGILMVVS